MANPNENSIVACLFHDNIKMFKSFQFYGKVAATYGLCERCTMSKEMNPDFQKLIDAEIENRINKLKRGEIVYGK